MSWKDHISTLEKSNGITKAAIFDLKGQVYGISENFPLTKEQVLDVIQGFGNPILFESAPKLPVGEKWEVKHVVCYKVTEESIYIKFEGQGYVFCKSKMLVVVGYYDNKFLPQEAVPAVEKYRNYLVENGY